MSDPAARLHLYILGPPEARLGERLLTFPTRKSLALLIYLAVESRPQPRESLAAMLWPETNPKRSHANLRNTLNHLQSVLRPADGSIFPSYLSITYQSLGFNLEVDMDFDFLKVERAYSLARADRSSRTPPQGSTNLPALQSAAASARGDFLSGFSLGDAPDFDDWAAIQREIWNRRLGLILDRLSEIQFASGEFTGATETTAHWIALDALNEVAYRRKMRAHFAAGERGQALETYESCRVLLAAELGLEPEPDTAALAERIRTQAPPVQPHIRRTVLSPRRPDTSVDFLGSLFAGRTREYQALIDSYGRATQGQTQLVVLRGEVGIGKSRLARKFLTWARAQGAEMLQGRAFESGSHLPFQPLVDALRLRFEGENRTKDLLDAVWFPQLSKLLPELSQNDGGFLTNPDDRTPAEAELSRTQLFEPLVQYTLALANRAPLVLFFDDMQWADSATLDLLLYALRRWLSSAALQDSVARIFLLVSLRSEALYPNAYPQQSDRPQGLLWWLERVERELTPNHIELLPLSEYETNQMLLSILAPPAVDFAQWLCDETRGQPFYLLETLKDLLERRVLHPTQRSEGQWTFAVDAEHDLGKTVRVPSTVHAVIRSRLNRLSPNAFSLLAAGAVLERHLTFERLCAISYVPEDLALPALDELISSRLLLESTQPNVASAYALTNDMLRDVVYTEAGDARRRLFHQRALEILETDGTSAAVLAYHAQAGSMLQAAYRYCLIAGQEALRLSAVSEAIIHFERARQLVLDAALPDIPDQSTLRELYLPLSRAYELGGLPEKAIAVRAEWAQMDSDQP